MQPRLSTLFDFRLLLPAMGLVVVGLGLPAAAADDVSIVAVKVDPLLLYAAPGDASPAASAPASSLPLPVREVRGDFMRVTVGGRDFWVDSMTVRASRKTAARCAAVAGAGKVAGELGAGTDRCK